MKLRSAALLSILALPALALACSSFESVSSVVADAGNEATVIVADPPDAAEADVTTPPSALCGDASVCETFDTPDWSNAWSVASAAALSTTDSDVISPPSALLLAVKSDNGLQFLNRALRSGAKRYYARLQIKVSELGDGEIDLFGLRTTDAQGKMGQLRLVYSATRMQLVLERADTPTSGQVQTPVPADLSRWNEMTIGLDYDVRRTTVTVNGIDVVTHDLPVDFPLPTDVRVELGVLYASGLTRPWVVRVDDVVAGNLD